MGPRGERKTAGKGRAPTGLIGPHQSLSGSTGLLFLVDIADVAAAGALRRGLPSRGPRAPAVLFGGVLAEPWVILEDLGKGPALCGVRIPG